VISVVRGLGRGALEMALVAALVLSVFVLLLEGLELAFPSGTTLSQLVRRDVLPAAAGLDAADAPQLLLSRDGASGAALDGAAVVALLADRRNTVKSKRASEIAWSRADTGMQLFNRDAVQTFSGASALVRFDEQSFIDMNENTLVIIRRLEHDPLLSERNAGFLVLAGELRGRLMAAGPERVRMNLATASAETAIESLPAAAGTEFKVRVNKDRSSTITVLDGRARITARDRSVELRENQTITIVPDQEPPAPKNLPQAITLVSPANRTSIPYRDLPPKVTFVWNAANTATGYRVQVARDAAFRDLIAEEVTPRAHFAHGSLKEGRYYWRVSARRDWEEGEFSATRELTLVRDVAPPSLTVEPVASDVRGDQVTVRGRTEPGSTVFANGEPVKVGADGSFAHAAPLKPGVNVIVVESSDSAGNVNYHSSTVNARM
jgi:mannose-6-phosphate isomerase-like protein (cupin superfamily)